MCTYTYLLPNDCILVEDRKLANMTAHESADLQAPKSQTSELSIEALCVPKPQGSVRLQSANVLKFD